MLEIQWEKLPSLLASGMAEHTVAQWLESGSDRDFVPIDVDWGRYQALENAGSLKLLSARKDGELVGYAAFFITPHLMYRSSTHVICDSIYVDPRHRGIGPSLVRAAEKQFKAMAGSTQVRVIYSAQIASDFPQVLNRLGYHARETVHVKIIGGAT